MDDFKMFTNSRDGAQVKKHKSTASEKFLENARVSQVPESFRLAERNSPNPFES